MDQTIPFNNFFDAATDSVPKIELATWRPHTESPSAFFPNSCPIREGTATNIDAMASIVAAMSRRVARPCAAFDALAGLLGSMIDRRIAARAALPRAPISTVKAPIERKHETRAGAEASNCAESNDIVAVARLTIDEVRRRVTGVDGTETVGVDAAMIESSPWKGGKLECEDRIRTAMVRNIRPTLIGTGRIAGGAGGPRVFTSKSQL